MKYSIHVTEAKNQAGNVRGFANLVFGDSFKITNIAILENKEKGTLLYPCRDTNPVSVTRMAV